MRIKSLIVNICWKVIQWAGAPIKTNSSNLPDLCPTDNASHVEEYIDRLNEVLVNRGNTVREIAITAPYSGGKSSLINTYRKRAPHHNYTCISLASFNETTKIGQENKEYLDQIEKSIVQQILYRTESKDTPNSRFRKIYPVPLKYSSALFTASSLILWLLLLEVLKTSSTHSLSLSTIIDLSNHSTSYIWIISYLLALPTLITKDIYEVLHKLDITKFNPINGEIELEKKNNDSVFNIYLEEIIYYFQTTGSDIVIFEDLDRFEKPEIFIKLKELNKLINDSIDIKQNVRFIYALRDDVFTGKNRTKFFDVIIPIIPITGKSNSYPQLKELLKNSELSDDLSDNFIRDISAYLDDMRILKNIVSEYGIYKKTLTPHLLNIDHSKLFGFIIYKNIYCDEFSKLHNNEGILFNTINQVSKAINTIEDNIKTESNAIENELISINNESTNSIQEINSNHLLLILEKLSPQNIITTINNRNIYSIPNPEIFDSLLKDKNKFTWSTIHGQNNQSTKNFSSYIDQIGHNYEERKENIINKSNNRISILEKKLKHLQQYTNSIQNFSLKDFANSESSDQVLLYCKEKPLLKHMIQKGYIDEHYHLYTTIFIEGHMTRSDMDYIMSVKNNKPLNKDKKIHNPEETLKYLSDEEFKNLAFLNYDIVSYLLNKNNTAAIKSFINTALLNSSDRFSITLNSIEKLNDKKKWVNILLNTWNTLFIDLLESQDTSSEITSEIICLLLSNLSDYSTFKQLVNSKDHLEKYLVDNYSIQFFFPVDNTKRNNLFESLNHLNIKFKSLKNCKDNISFLNHVLKNKTFIINKDNLSIILASIGKSSDTDALKLSDLKSIKNNDFQVILDEEINKIAQLISTDEISISTEIEIIDIINNPEVISDTKFALIDNVGFVLSEIDSIMDTLFYEVILKNRKLVFSWENIKTIIASEKVPHEILAEIFNNDEITKNLSSSDTTLNQSVSEIILNIIALDIVDINNFKEMYKFLDYIYQDSELKNLHHDKAAYLITNNELTATAETFNTLKAISTELSSLFIAANFKLLHKEIVSGESIDISTDEFYEILSFDNMSIEDKRTFITLKSNLIIPSRDNFDLIAATLISLDNDHFKDSSIPNLSKELLLLLIDSIKDSDIRKHFFLSQLQHLNTSEIETTLQVLDDELSSITKTKSYTLIKNTEINLRVSSALKIIGYISTFTIRTDWFSGEKIRINVKTKAPKTIQ
jgi:hypothetical protein